VKKCTKCGEVKPESEFYSKGKNRPVKLFSACKLCTNKANAAWVAENKERMAALISDWSKRNPDKRRETYKKYRNRNPDKVAKATKSWRNRNKPLIAHHAANRRARIKNATPAWADDDAIKSMYHRCPDGHHVDHIIPLTSDIVCGLHTEDNLQYLTASENHRKFNSFHEDIIKILENGK
jgi:hypothetical protein